MHDADPVCGTWFRTTHAFRHARSRHNNPVSPIHQGAHHHAVSMLGGRNSYVCPLIPGQKVQRISQKNRSKAPSKHKGNVVQGDSVLARTGALLSFQKPPQAKHVPSADLPYATVSPNQVFIEFLHEP